MHITHVPLLLAVTLSQPVARTRRDQREARAGVFGEKLTSLGSEVAGGTPEQFAALIRKETVKWGDVMQRAGITIE